MRRSRLVFGLEGLPDPKTPPIPEYRPAPDYEFGGKEGGEYCRMRPSEVREASPYGRGDVVWIDRYGFPAIAVIDRMVGCHWLEGSQYWVPQYRVRPLTTRGAWSIRWFYAYPGTIQRGYKLAIESGLEIKPGGADDE